MTDSELRNLEYLSKWAARKYGLPWQEIQSEAFIRFYKYNYRVMSVCVAHAAGIMIWDLKRNKHLELVHAPKPDGTIPNWYPTTVDAYDIDWVDEFRSITKGALKTDRDALFLFTLGHSHAEIAKALNTTEAASRRRVFRAKKHILEKNENSALRARLVTFR